MIMKEINIHPTNLQIFSRIESIITKSQVLDEFKAEGRFYYFIFLYNEFIGKLYSGRK